MKIAVTGGSGFIGTKLCSLLKAQGHEVVILDIKPSGAFPKERIDADVRDYDAVLAAMKGCEAVYHLAAEHADDVQPVSLYYDVNVEGGKTVIKACEALGIEKIIFTSTVALYGLDAGNSVESDEAAPFNDYGRSKYESEQTFRAWAEGDARRSLIITRLVATFDVGNRGNVYNLLRQIAGGKFIMIGEGKNCKSLAYLGNVAAFLVHVLSLGGGVHIYNYADKPDMNMHDLVCLVRGSLGKEGVGVKLPYLAGLMGGYCFDILAKITGRSFPISSIRVKKFCADTIVNADKAHASGFKPPYRVEDGLKIMIEGEFVKPSADAQQTDKKAA